jgi:gliding motility-associated-like protein
MKLKKVIILILFAFIAQKNFATHIVGGEIYYDYLGANNYKITLKVYRDCYTGMAAYDNPATIFIFNSAGTFIDSVEIPFPGSVQLPVTISNPCFTPPTNICVEEAIYTTTIHLPNTPGGYDIVYQRCCRNNTILNLVAPGSVGSTYMAHIPDNTVAPGNSSPRYTNFPPIFLCSGVPLLFDHSATDPDGDSLYYELCDPFIGLDASCPMLGSGAASGCATIASPPPYPFVPFLSPYTGTYPMSASPVIAVDPNTGFMTGTPNMIGQWVVGVCVSEYRGGVLIDVNKRDFQFNVVNCPGLPVASIPLQSQFCFGYTSTFSSASVGAFSYHWDFGDPSTTLDTSNLLNPTWTYADSGVYHVSLIINAGSMCADTATVTFFIYPLLAPTFSPPPGECVYNNSYDFSAGGAFMGNGTFTWGFGSHATPSTAPGMNPTGIVFDSAGTFPVTLTVSENGCTQSHTENINVWPKPVADYNLGVSVACDLQPVLFFNTSTGDTPMSYVWSFGDGGVSTSQNPEHLYPAIGNYNSQLIVSTAHGCKDTFALPSPVSVFPSPIAGITVNPRDTSIFYPEITAFDVSSGAVDCMILWGDGSSSSNCDTMHSYGHPGTYTIMQIVTNAAGCKDTAYIDVLIRPEYLFWIPNAFTPNNNGLNDVFKPKLIGVHDYSFLIFDRWGEKIFETHDALAGWDGMYKGRLCTNDVFVWKINLKDDVLNEEHQFIGHVTLVK